MRSAARFSRIPEVVAGIAVASFGLLALLGSRGTAPTLGLLTGPRALSAVTAFGLLAAGLALALLAVPARAAVRRRAGYGCAGATVVLGAAGLVDALAGLPVTEAVSRVTGAGPGPHHAPPAAALAITLVGAALVVVDLGRVPGRVSPATPLLVGAATIALVGLTPALVALAAPPEGTEPDGVIPAPTAAALLVLAVGALSARSGTARGAVEGIAAGGAGGAVEGGTEGGAEGGVEGAVEGAAEGGAEGVPAGAAATVGRRLAPLLLGLPVVVALVSALAARGGVSRPAAVSTGAIVALLALIGGAGLVLRSVDRAERQQRDVLAELRRRTEVADQLLAAENQANEQLAESNQKLNAALAFKSDLTAMLTHDVSQPISSIASLAELLTDAWDDLDDKDRHQLAAKIDRNTRRLISMMNDLTLLFRLDTGSVTARRTPVPVREVVQTAISAVCPDGPEITVDVPAELSVLADRGHVWHVVQHLVRNAVTFGAPPVRVHGRVDEGLVVIVVEDCGNGVPEAVVPNLFDRFMRGTGMGLFIVRHLVEANGGSVRYEPAEPGARLVVTLERALAPTTTPATEVAVG